MSFRLCLFLFCIIIWGCGSNQNQANISPRLPVENYSKALVAIVPYHDMDSNLVTMVSNELEDFYGIKTQILPKDVMPDSCKNPYKHRYNANKILQYLQAIKPTNIPFILALTTEGIATKKGKYKEWGILGLGTCPGPCCVISTANMGVVDDQLKDRLVKVSLHEMGHNFGLPHCTQKNAKCLMRDANGTVLTIDEEDKYLCPKCAKYLSHKGFNLKINRTLKSK